MSENMSPGITIRERENTLQVQNTAVTAAAMVIRGTKGPLNVRTLLTSENDLVTNFGKPNDDTYKYFFTAKTYFDGGGDTLYVVRVEHSEIDCAGVVLSATASSSAGAGQYGPNYLVTSAENTFTAGDYPLLNRTVDVAQDDISFTSNQYLMAQALGAGEYYNDVKIAVVNYSDYTKLKSMAVEIAEAGTSTALNTVGKKYYGDLTTESFSSDSLRDEIITKDGTTYTIDTTRINEFLSLENGPTSSDEFVVYVYVVSVENGETKTDLYEKFLVSKTLTKKNTLGESMFAETYINARSNLVQVFIDENKTLVSSGLVALSGAESITTFEGANPSLDIEDEIYTGFNSYLSNVEEFSVDILIDADYGTAAKLKMIEIAENTRKDCMVVGSLPISLIVNTLTDVTLTTATSGMIDYMNNTLNSSSKYAAFYGNCFKVRDAYNQTERWIPAAGPVAGQWVYNDLQRNKYHAPFGLEVGVIPGIIKLGINPDKPRRDVLFQARINPIYNKSGVGPVIMGDSTLYNKNSVFNSINVRRTFNIMEINIGDAAQYFLARQNNSITRSNLTNTIIPYLARVAADEGITSDYSVVCDDTNNPSDSSTELYVDIYVTPIRAIRNIRITFIATQSGVSFAETE